MSIESEEPLEADSREEEEATSRTNLNRTKECAAGVENTLIQEESALPETWNVTTVGSMDTSPSAAEKDSIRMQAPTTEEEATEVADPGEDTE